MAGPSQTAVGAPQTTFWDSLLFWRNVEANAAAAAQPPIDLTQPIQQQVTEVATAAFERMGEAVIGATTDDADELLSLSSWADADEVTERAVDRLKTELLNAQEQLQAALAQNQVLQNENSQVQNLLEITQAQLNEAVQTQIEDATAGSDDANSNQNIKNLQDQVNQLAAQLAAAKAALPNRLVRMIHRTIDPAAKFWHRHGLLGRVTLIGGIVATAATTGAAIAYVAAQVKAAILEMIWGPPGFGTQEVANYGLSRVPVIVEDGMEKRDKYGNKIIDYPQLLAAQAPVVNSENEPVDHHGMVDLNYTDTAKATDKASESKKNEKDEL